MDHSQPLIEKYFGWFTILAAALVVAGGFLYVQLH